MYNCIHIRYIVETLRMHRSHYPINSRSGDIFLLSESSLNSFVISDGFLNTTIAKETAGDI